MTKNTLLSQSFVPWKFHPRNSDFEPQPGGAAITAVTLQLNGGAAPVANGTIDESYSLQVTSDGQATITATTANGLSYGLNTFTQLFYCHSQGGTYTPYAPVQIQDKPTFSHRGLNLDVSRHYYPPSDINRTIDALAYNKFNRLHVHITDAQSWPLVIPAIPELSDEGAFTAGLVYTPEQIDSLQQYAASRGIDMFLEIDMPGDAMRYHCASIQSRLTRYQVTHRQ